MADQDDQTAVRVSGGVIYGEVCVCVCSQMSVRACGRIVHRAPSLPTLSNHGADLLPLAERL